MSLINTQVTSISAESSNKLYLRIQVRNILGMPVQNAHVLVSAAKNKGVIEVPYQRTDKNGELIATYTPPDYKNPDMDAFGTDLVITSRIAGTDKYSTISLTLARVPVIYIHGYMENPSIYANMKDYLTDKGFKGEIFSYKSTYGVASASKELSNYLDQQKKLMLAKGFQVKKFDIVAHSMGGIVARYYSCGEDYIRNNDIRKIIFLSTPHKGSPWASVGINYFNDLGIKDLMPDSDLLAKVLPGMLNKGLNNSIQTGNIIAQYDEVVSPESANLNEWNIRTEVFNVGGNNFTMDNLLNGNIMEAPNHKNILNNKKVFEKVEEMLSTNLPYPSVKK